MEYNLKQYENSPLEQTIKMKLASLKYSLNDPIVRQSINDNFNKSHQNFESHTKKKTNPSQRDMFNTTFSEQPSHEIKNMK